MTYGTSCLYSIIADEMKDMGLPYDFMDWNFRMVPNTYWIGEPSSSPITTEDGYEETTFILTGTTKETWMELDELRKKIQKRFHPISGLHSATKDGAVAIYYSNSFPVPTGEANLKRIQINLTCKEWRNIQ